MKRNQGFSLTEVVISLFLMTFVSLVLLKHHWQTRLSFNQLQQQRDVFLRSENAHEHLFTNMFLPRRALGIGLPELLIALFLSSLVILGLMRQYLTIKSHYQQMQNTLRQNIELELVSEMIRDSVRKAGFTPCSGIHYLKTIDQRSSQRTLADIEITNDTYPSLKFNRMNENFDTLIQIINPYEVLVTRLHPLFPKQPVVIADCFHAEVQNIKQVTVLAKNQLITLYKPLFFSYNSSTYLGEWIEEQFYIHPKKTNSSALYYKVKHAEELTPLIKNLQADLFHTQYNTLLKIAFDLKNSKVLELETMVRMR